MVLSCYLVVSYFLYVFFVTSENPKLPSNILFVYGFSTQFFLYAFQYRSLRNFNYYICWIVVGIAHFFIYFEISDDPRIILPNANAAVELRNTFFSLILFQILRFISLRLQKMELVMIDRSGFNYGDNRKNTTVDIILFIIFFIYLALVSF